MWSAVKYSKVIITPSEACNCLYQLQSISISSYCPDLNLFVAYFSKSLNSAKAPLPPKIVCSAIYGLRGLKPTQEIRDLISSLALKVNECEMYYHSINICIAINGLQGMDDNVSVHIFIYTLFLEMIFLKFFHTVS